jgi:hypothetical protein
MFGLALRALAMWMHDLKTRLKTEDSRTAFALNGYFPVFSSSGLFVSTFLRTADAESFE